MAIPIAEDPYSANCPPLIWSKSVEESEPPPSYRPESLNAICSITKFTRREVQIIYRSFKQGCPTGVVDKKQFQEIFAQFFPRGNPKRYAELVFMTLDHDHDEFISFEEFVIGLSVLTRGSLEEKLDWVFTLYDVQRKELIGIEELLNVTQAIYEMMGRQTTKVVTKSNVVDHVTDVYQKMCERTGEMYFTRQRFIDICTSDKQLCESILLFDTLL